MKIFTQSLLVNTYISVKCIISNRISRSKRYSFVAEIYADILFFSIIFYSLTHQFRLDYVQLRNAVNTFKGKLSLIYVSYSKRWS